jgi:hypothetical protein
LNDNRWVDFRGSFFRFEVGLWIDFNVDLSQGWSRLLRESGFVLSVESLTVEAIFLIELGVLLLEGGEEEEMAISIHGSIVRMELY